MCVLTLAPSAASVILDPVPKTEPAMKTPMIAAAAALFTTTALADGHLPDLGGQEIVVVTENAYPPLQFIDGDGNAVAVVQCAVLACLRATFRKSIFC